MARAQVGSGITKPFSHAEVEDVKMVPAAAGAERKNVTKRAYTKKIPIKKFGKGLC